MSSAVPLLEIAICTHNNAGLLEQTLRSLASQKTRSGLQWSVLVVDNASTDNTRETVQAAIASGCIPNLRQVYEEEPGLVPARLRGVRETSAAWLAFVDDDCLLDEAWVANAVAFIETHSDCGAFGGIVRLKWESPPADFVTRYGYAYAQQEHGERISERHWLVGAGLVLNRRALEQSGWPRKQYLADRKGTLLLSGGDMEMVLRIRAAGYKLWYNPFCILRHCIPAKRTTLEYLTRINFGLGVSQAWCDLLVCGRPFRKFLAAALVDVARSYLRSAKQAAGVLLGKRGMEDVRITLSFARGRLAGVRQVASLNGGSRAEVLGCARPDLAGAR